MFEYPAEIFGAKMREEKFGKGEEQYILYCYDIFGGTYSVRVDGYFISSRFDYGDTQSSSFRSRDGFEGFEKNAYTLVKLVLDYFIENQKEQ